MTQDGCGKDERGAIAYPRYQEIYQQIYQLAEHHREDGVALLQLLRMLERLHRDIRDNLFQETLPQTRNQLYSLLKDIEAEGGWPYISRMRLRELMIHFLFDEDEASEGRED